MRIALMISSLLFWWLWHKGRIVVRWRWWRRRWGRVRITKNCWQRRSRGVTWFHDGSCYAICSVSVVMIIVVISRLHHAAVPIFDPQYHSWHHGHLLDLVCKHRQGWISELPKRITVYWLLQHFNFGDSVSPHAVSVRMPDSDEDSDKGLCHQEHDVSSGVLFHTSWCLLVQRKWEERRHLSPLGSEPLLQAVSVQRFPADQITHVCEPR